MEKFIHRANLVLSKKRLAESHNDAEPKVLLKLLADEETKELPPKGNLEPLFASGRRRRARDVCYPMRTGNRFIIASIRDRWCAGSICNSPQARAASRLSVFTALGIIALAFGATRSNAQEAEPRSYSNTPVGLNFLIAGYGYSKGKMAFDPDLAIANANFNSSTAALAYVRSFDFAGQSAKFDVIVPTSSFSAHALVDGQPRQREMSGLGDPRFRVSVNLLGAPALSAKDFASYKQDLIVGMSLQVSAPLGQYDNSKLLNLGNNRWSFKPELGLSKAWGPWTFEVAPSATFFTDNTDFFGGNTFAQAPIYAVQGHILYTSSPAYGWRSTGSTSPAAAPPSTA